MALRRHDPHEIEARTERIERVEHIHEAPATPLANVNVGAPAAAADAVTIFTRVVLLVLTVLEALLLFRFIFKLTGANQSQPLVAWLYAFTDPLVRPFQGIFPEPKTITVVDVPALLSIVFLFLIAWLVVALVRAIAGRAP